jgi:hypothetical protein
MRLRARFQRHFASKYLATPNLPLAPQMGHAQSSGPTRQPPAVPVTPEQAEQVTEQQWAIHGHTTTWEFQPAFRFPYEGAHSLSGAAKPSI